MVRAITIAALVILLGYGFVEGIPLLAGPHISLTSPGDGQSFSDGFVRITGTAAHTENLTLDGAPLLIDSSGHFDTTLVLPHGGAILSLTATDRFGKSQSVRRTIFVP
ncbi:MAG: hypothetical protein ACM3TU_03320 [Bacillota bacterium]